MVSFGLRLRDNTYAEWRDDYLDYRRLKHALTTPHELSLRRSASSSSDLNSHSDTECQALLVARRSVLKPPPQAATFGSFADTQSRPLAPERFAGLLHGQFDKVERAYGKHLAHLSAQFALLREQYRPAASQAAHDSVRNTLVVLHRLLNHLLNFAVLNYTGFVKILQKHDALYAAPPRSFHARLHELAFADATECRALLMQVELMFTDVFCDGNRSVAVAFLLKRREDTIDWAPVSIGIKIGSCAILLVWVVWDSLLVPTFTTERERHIVDLTLTRAFPVYRGIGCCLLLHWLIGLSLFVWRSARINYQYIFELNPRTTPHHTEIFSDATDMSIVFLANVLLYYKVVNGYFPEQILHRGYYPLVLFMYTIYFYILRPWRRQRGLLKTLVEIMGSPFFPVTFFHVFVGNYLTSCVKLNQDLAWSVCFFVSKEFLMHEPTGPGMLHAQDRLDATESSCRTNFYYVNVVVPLICALPLWWRFLQSLRRIYDTQMWWPNLPNAFTYALAHIVALFGLFHPFYSASDEPESDFSTFHAVWISLFTLSSLCTWAWDVWMDWGLGRPQYKFLGDRQMFSHVWVYYAAIVADLFLRFAWTLTLIPPQSSPSLPLYLQPFTMVSELFRRAFWGFFRVENEHLRNTQGFRRVDFIPLHYDQGGVGDKKAHNRSDHDQMPLSVHVLLMEIMLILVAVLGLSVLAIVVQK